MLSACPHIPTTFKLFYCIIHKTKLSLSQVIVRVVFYAKLFEYFHIRTNMISEQASKSSLKKNHFTFMFIS